MQYCCIQVSTLNQHGKSSKSYHIELDCNISVLSIIYFTILRNCLINQQMPLQTYQIKNEAM